MKRFQKLPVLIFALLLLSSCSKSVVVDSGDKGEFVLKAEYSPVFEAESENNLPPLEYEIVDDWDVNYGPVIQLDYAVVIPKNSDEAYVIRVAKDLINNITAEQDVNTISLFFRESINEPNYIYDVAKINWLPYGDFLYAKEIPTGTYEHHELETVYYTEIEERQKKQAEYKAYMDKQ